MVEQAAATWGQDTEALREDLCCLFMLDRVEANADGTFNLYAPRDSGREMRNVDAVRAMAIIAVRWAPGGSRAYNWNTGAP